MLAALAVPYVDTRAAGLSWWLGDAPSPLASLSLPGPLGGIELRLLGASHQVVARAGDATAPEVVACRPGPVTPLPGTTRLLVDGADYRFASTTTSYDETGTARVAAALRRRHGGDDRSLVGAFPGSADALTVLTARPLASGWAWRTWHVYPGSGEVVRTTGSLRLAARPS
ncbi:MAG: DUF2617 family protein [Mycobacteriales bacterium]|nr:DUF2617 family protein [Mycobacteriales bacterium]